MIQAKDGKTQDAIATVKRGMEVNPYSPRLFGLLAALYTSVSSYDEALKTMRKDLELFPGDDFTRSLMRRIETAQAQGGSHLKDPR
jgi:tetratricopeptide (TPR) repeat protein